MWQFPLSSLHRDRNGNYYIIIGHILKGISGLCRDSENNVMETNAIAPVPLAAVGVGLLG